MFNKLFVYGTLQKGRPAHCILASAGARFVGAGKVQGILYDRGDFPALVRNGKKNALVAGQVYELGDPEAALRILDEYEEFDPSNVRYSLFIRKRVRIDLAGGSEITAWVYFYNRAVVGSELSRAGQKPGCKGIFRKAGV